MRETEAVSLNREAGRTPLWRCDHDVTWQFVDIAQSVHAVVLGDNGHIRLARPRLSIRCEREPDNGEEVWTYTFEHRAERHWFTIPAYDIRDCVYGNLDGCRKVQERNVRTVDLPGGRVFACPCCGHQSTHRVLRDGSDMPMCMVKHYCQKCRREVAANTGRLCDDCARFENDLALDRGE